MGGAEGKEAFHATDEKKKKRKNSLVILTWVFCSYFYCVLILKKRSLKE